MYNNGESESTNPNEIIMNATNSTDYLGIDYC